MRHYPAFLDLVGRRALVLGAGENAARKAAALARAGADVVTTVNFDSAQLQGCAIAIGADAEEADLVALSRAAIMAGIPVNIVDRPKLCSFITPSVIDRDPITIAVSSSGAAPVLARLIRARIEALIAPAYGRLAALADRFKTETRQKYPDTAARRRLLEQLLTGPAAELIFAGRDDEAASIFEAALRGESASEPGIVHLVGAGPGAADLLTLRAHRLLGEADVIVHDRLVSAEVLDMARRDARRIYVGKVRAHHCVPQDQLNDLLIELARAGQKVIRLKGGDPFIFGRGGEEAEALIAAGIRVEIVPGITAALACAAQAGIPLTHRDAARSVTFVTGHTRDGRLDLDFAPLVRSRTTLAVYMGLVTLPALRAGLEAQGLDPQTPAMLIERGGSPRQRELRGTLAELEAGAEQWSTGGATLVLIGPAIARGGRTSSGGAASLPTTAAKDPSTSG